MPERVVAPEEPRRVETPSPAPVPAPVAAPPPPYYPPHPAPPAPYPGYAPPPPPYPAYAPAPQPYPPYQAPQPPQPSQADHPSQAAYPPAQYGAPPQYAYAPPYGYAPSQRRPGRLGRLSRNAWLGISAGIVVAALLLGVIAYAIAGYVVSQNEISNGSNAINALSSHRTSINSSFDNIAQRIISLDPQGSGAAGKTTATLVVSGSQSMATAVAGSPQSLRTAQVKLNDLAWLTAFSRGSLQDESARLDHARKAVADVKTAADDYALLGGFLQSYFQVFSDLDNLNTANKNNDAAGFFNAFSALRTDLANSIQLAAAVPGLPTQFRDWLSALQAEANDVRQRELAAAAGDQAAVAAAQKAIDADSAKIDAVDFSGTTAAIHSYYQRIRDDFNSQMDEATA